MVFRSCLLLFLFFINIYNVEGSDCTFPESWSGGWFQLEHNYTIPINSTHINTNEECVEIQPGNKYVVFDRSKNCYKCLVMDQKHNNVLQYKSSDCASERESACITITNDTRTRLYWLFRKEPLPKFETCPFYGTPFNIEITVNSSVCSDEPAYARQTLDGSLLLNPPLKCTLSNMMHTGGSVIPLNEVTVKCLAAWHEDSTQYVIGRIYFDEHSFRFKYGDKNLDEVDTYRCLTVQTQDTENSTTHNIVVSVDATCNNVSPSTENITTITLSSECLLPKRSVGTWYHPESQEIMEIKPKSISPIGECADYNKTEHQHSVLFYNRQSYKYQCLIIEIKHDNVLKFVSSPRVKAKGLACDMVNKKNIKWLFRKSPPKPVLQQCPFSASYFSLTYKRGGNECANQPQRAVSSPNGSHMRLHFMTCPGIQGTETSVEELVCMAEWKEGSKSYLMGQLWQLPRQDYIEDTYRCFLYDTQTSENGTTYTIVQSEDGTCNGLASPTDANRIMTFTSTYGTLYKWPLEAGGSRCIFPEKWYAKWFQSGVLDLIPISSTHFNYTEECFEIESENKYVVFNKKQNCYRCLVIHEMHSGVLQYKASDCLSERSSVCDMISSDTSVNWLIRKDPALYSFACPFDFEYFTLIYNKGTGICTAFDTFAKKTSDGKLEIHVNRYCSNLPVTKYSGSNEILTCLAMWQNGDTKYLVGRLAHLKDLDESLSDEDTYRCLAFKSEVVDKHLRYNIVWSNDATCNGLSSPTNESRIMTLISVCAMPEKWRGPWYHTGIPPVEIERDGIEKIGLCDTYLGENKYLLRPIIPFNKYRCIRLEQIHENVLKYKISPMVNETYKWSACDMIDEDEPFQWMFRKYPSGMPHRIPFPHGTTFRLTYNLPFTGKPACEDPRHNAVTSADGSKLTLTYVGCPQISTSTIVQDILALGTWKEGFNQYFLGAIYSGHGTYKELFEYRCFLYDSKTNDNVTTYTLIESADRSCNNLTSPTDRNEIMTLTTKTKAVELNETS